MFLTAEKRVHIFRVLGQPPRARLILIGISILALVVSVLVLVDRSSHGPSHKADVDPGQNVPSTSGDGQAQKYAPARKRDTIREYYRPEASRPAVSEETLTYPVGVPTSEGLKKRRAVQFTISGFVSNSQNGAPIENARLTVSPAAHDDVVFQSDSGSDGRFQLTVLSSGKYVLRAEAAGFRPYSTDRLIIYPSQESLQKKILMTPRVELRGRVVDRNSQGISRAAVWLREESPGPFDRESMVETDESGHFLMPRAPVSGSYFAEAAHSEYELESRVPVTLPVEDSVVITMRRVPASQLASISGHVWNTDGQPIHGGTVSLTEIESGRQDGNFLGDSSTDPTGRYYFSRVRRSSYLLFAHHEDFAHATAGQGSKVITIASRGEYEVDLVLAGQTIVEGVVVNEEGVSVGKARVLVRFEKGNGMGAFTPSDGSFKIPSVPPGRHQIEVAHSDYLFYESILLTPTDPFLTLTLRSGLSLTGVVVDQHRAPVKECLLRLRPTSGQGETKTAEVSPSDGYFRVAGLAPETYSVHVRSPKADSFETHIELLESTSVTIVLDPSDSGSPLQILKSW